MFQSGVPLSDAINMRNKNASAAAPAAPKPRSTLVEPIDKRERDNAYIFFATLCVQDVNYFLFSSPLPLDTEVVELISASRYLTITPWLIKHPKTVEKLFKTECFVELSDWLLRLEEINGIYSVTLKKKKVF
jgi:hypothetical protein